MWRLCLTAFLLSCCLRGAETRASVVVIAHRGNHEQAHENTLEAIRNAALLGVDYVEVDVRVTRDGRHVLMHDRTVRRMTGVDGAVKELSLDEIRRLQVRDPARPDIPPAQVPTFEEVLDVLGTRLGLYLDFKDGDPVDLIAQLRRRGLLGRTVVYLEPSEIPAWKEAGPGLRFIASLPETSRAPADVATWVRRYPGVVLDGPVTGYTAEMVEAAHALGALVWPDIQGPLENRELWVAALRLGVDGLQTDHPSALLASLRAERIAVAEPMPGASR